MLSDFRDAKRVLIITRLRPAATVLGLCRQAAQSYGQPDPRYLLQGRDDNLGRFIPSQECIPMGSNQGRVLP